jgi:hypothetical protein
MLDSLLNINANVKIFLMVFLICGLYYFKIENNLLTNIIITALCIAFFDAFLKKILLFNKTDNYYIFIINNVITIICINLLFFIIKQDTKNLNILNFGNMIFACFFYEFIVFKLYNYNKLHNDKLRKITKTILRLATIHILTTYLNGGAFDKKWFDYSIGQITNLSIFNSIFEN